MPDRRHRMEDNIMDRQIKWAQQARENARACRQALISSRVELALVRVSQDPGDQALCKNLGDQDEQFRVSLERLSDDEQEAISQYLEQLTEKERYELDEAYMQGVKDCMHMLIEMEMFQRERSA